MLEPLLNRAWLERKPPLAPLRRLLPLLRLSGALLANLLALLLAFFLGGDERWMVLLAFMAAVMVTSWLGGRLAGLGAVAFATWAANYLVFSPGSLAVDFPDDFLRLSALAAGALLVSTVNSSRSALERSEQLRRSAERTRAWAETLLDQGLAPVLLLHPETQQVLFDNRAARALAGGQHPLAQANGPESAAGDFTSMGSRLTPEEMPAARAARGESVPSMRLEWHLPEGTRKLLVSARRLDGSPEHQPLVLLSYQDFTEVETAGEALRRSETLYQTLADAAPVGIFHVDVAGHMLYANDRGRELLRAGDAASDLQLQRLSDPNWKDPEADWKRALAAGDKVAFECRLSGPGSEARWLAVGLSPIRDGAEDGGRVVSYVGTVDDLTDRKRAEEELQRLSDQRAELVSTVSHALRGPIAAMLVNLEVVRDTAQERLDAQDERFLEHAVRAALDLSATVDSILSLSRLQSGRVQARLEPCSLADVAGCVYRTMLPRAVSREVALELMIERAEPVVSDPAQLEVVANELVENAIKYTPAGGRVVLSLRAAAGAAPDGGDAMCLSVRDSGPGLNPADIPHLFEPFFRGQAADRSQVKGSGLGLAIAARIASLLNGTLVAGNHPEGGAVFELVVPRWDERAASPEARAANEGVAPVH